MIIRFVNYAGKVLLWIVFLQIAYYFHSYEKVDSFRGRIICPYSNIGIMRTFTQNTSSTGTPAQA